MKSFYDSMLTMFVFVIKAIRTLMHGNIAKCFLRMLVSAIKGTTLFCQVYF